MAHAIGFPAIQFPQTPHVRGGSVSRRGLSQLTGIRTHSQAEPTMQKQPTQTPTALRERGVWGERGFSQRSRLSPQNLRHPSPVFRGGSAREGTFLQKSPLPRILIHPFGHSGDEWGDGMLRWMAVLVMIAQIVGGAQWDNAKTALAMRAGILLRLHVVANSDDAEDQRVKLCVRDAVQDAYQARAAEGEPMLKQAQEMLPELQMAAEKAARQEGFDGSVTATIENIAFDARELDGLTIPAGIYPALMVRLGDAQGHNWWGLLDRDAALSAAEVNAPGLCIWTSGGVQWTLSLPALFAQWFLGEAAA